MGLPLTTRWGHRYYICMNVRPPHVSSIHPLGPIRQASPPIEEYSNSEIQSAISAPTRLPEPASLNPSSPLQPRSPSFQSQPSGLSFAQQLYASSIKSASNSSMYFARESNAIRPFPAPLTTIPTPPSSPPPNASVLAQTAFPASVASPSTSYNVSELYGTPLASRSRRQDSVHYSSRGAGATHGSVDHSFPRRSQSYQLTTSPVQENFQLHPHRASTFPAGNAKQNGTPTLVTTARPPTNLFTPVSQTAVVPPGPPPKPDVMAAPIPLLSSPPNLNSLSTAALQAETYPIQSSAQAALPPTPISAQFTQSNQNQVSRSTQPSKGNETNPALKQIGLAVGHLAFNIAGGAVRASLGLPQTGGGVGGAIGKVLVNGTLDGDTMDSLSTSLSGLGDQGTGFDPSQMQAVQPEVDYQSAIGNLMQQQQAQATPGVNYQTIINQLELQRNRSVANPLQRQAAAYAPQVPNQPTTLGNRIQQPMQTGAQDSMSGYGNAYNVQTQALSPSEQQYQDALRVQLQQINAAAAQEVAQAQQNAQNILQAAYHQQQQMQLQQQHPQMQVAYSKPAPQNPVVQHTRPPPGPPVNHEPSGLNTLLTGVGSVLSSFAHAENTYSGAGGGDSYASDSSGDNFAAYSSFPDMGSDPTNC